eukprot:COSAG01_NODE_893_length_12880_cov_7.428371_5_plen_453_part_00
MGSNGASHHAVISSPPAVMERTVRRQAQALERMSAELSTLQEAFHQLAVAATPRQQPPPLPQQLQPQEGGGALAPGGVAATGPDAPGQAVGAEAAAVPMMALGGVSDWGLVTPVPAPAAGVASPTFATLSASVHRHHYQPENSSTAHTAEHQPGPSVQANSSRTVGTAEAAPLMHPEGGGSHSHSPRQRQRAWGGASFAPRTSTTPMPPPRMHQLGMPSPPPPASVGVMHHRIGGGGSGSAAVRGTTPLPPQAWAPPTPTTAAAAAAAATPLRGGVPAGAQRLLPRSPTGSAPSDSAWQRRDRSPSPQARPQRPRRRLSPHQPHQPHTLRSSSSRQPRLPAPSGARSSGGLGISSSGSPVATAAAATMSGGPAGASALLLYDEAVQQAEIWSARAQRLSPIRARSPPAAAAAAAAATPSSAAGSTSIAEALGGQAKMRCFPAPRRRLQWRRS